MSSENEQLLHFTNDNIFKKYDINQNEKLDDHEVAALLRDAFREMGSKQNVTADRVKLFISRVDKDGDMRISRDQMYEVLKKNQQN